LIVPPRIFVPLCKIFLAPVELMFNVAPSGTSYLNLTETNPLSSNLKLLNAAVIVPVAAASFCVA
jgi:hypothetical protein